MVTKRYPILKKQFNESKQYVRINILTLIQVEEAHNLQNNLRCDGKRRKEYHELKSIFLFITT